MANTFDQRHLIALYSLGLINELPIELGPMPVGEITGEITDDLRRWGIITSSGELSLQAAEQVAGIVDYEWALSGIVLLYSERQPIEVDLPSEWLDRGIQYSLRDIPRVTFLIGYRQGVLTTLTLARGHLAVAIDRVMADGPTGEYRDAAAIISALLDPSGQWGPYPMDEVAIPAATATALAVDRDADLDTVLESTVDTLREAEMGTPTVRALHDLLSAENVASTEIVLTRRTSQGKRRAKGTAAGVMFFDGDKGRGAVVSYPTRPFDVAKWITYEPATPEALTRAVTALHRAQDTAAPADVQRL